MNQFLEEIQTRYTIQRTLPGWPEITNAQTAYAAFPIHLLTAPDETYTRVDEPSLVHLDNGNLLFAYANHTGLKDNDRSDIVGFEIDSDGQQVTDQWTLIHRPPENMNVMSPAIRRLPDGRLGMVYSHRVTVKNASRNFVYSTDEGHTWSEPVVAAGGEYKTGCHDRFLVHSSGRLIAPCHCSDDWDKHYLHVRVAYSDDLGKSWTLGHKIELPQVIWPDGRHRHESGCVEPCVVERNDGSLLMTIRTAMGTQFKSESFDVGNTWSSPISMEVRSPQAPCYLTRFPNSDDLLIVWTPNYHVLARGSGDRTTMMTCVSADGGKSWPFTRRKVLIHDLNGSVSYPTVTFVKHEAFITLRISPKTGLLANDCGTALLKVPLQWFKE